MATNEGWSVIGVRAAGFGAFCGIALTAGAALAEAECAQGAAGFPACLEEFSVIVRTPDGAKKFSGGYTEAMARARNYIGFASGFGAQARASGALALGRLGSMLEAGEDWDQLDDWDMSCKFKWPPFCEITISW